MTRYLIIDDEPVAHDIIQGYCDMLPGLQLQKRCYDALEALDFLGHHRVDLIFLDLNLPRLKGFEFLRTLPSPPQVIVTTAYKEHALEGYELDVVDYLLKPFGFERFLKAVNKATNKSVPRASSAMAGRQALRRSIFLRSDKMYVQVFIDEILYLEAAGNYTKVITAKETVMIREKISDLLTTLDHDNFMQVHKSFVVSKQHIRSIQGNEIFLDDHKVPVGKTYKSQVSRLYT